jgi:arginase
VKETTGESSATEPGSVAVLGIRFVENASYLRGPAAAPDRIREALNAGASNLCAENGIDLEANPQ